MTTTPSVVDEAEAVLRQTVAHLNRIRPGECLLCCLWRQLATFPCDGTLRQALHFRDERAPRATAVAERLGRVGGYCDCEAFLNGYEPHRQFWVLERWVEQEGVECCIDPDRLTRSRRVRASAAGRCVRARTGCGSAAGTEPAGAAIMSGMTTQTATRIEFEAELQSIDTTSLVRLPPEASGQLPSRGQVAVFASVNGQDVSTVLEPDGFRGHWLRIDEQVRTAAGLALGDIARIAVETSKEWPEPVVPDDLGAALAQAAPAIREVWDDITPMARWEWVRWVDATANPATRQRRVEVTISKIDHGKRRPCCFDLSACTDPAVARSGKLREPS